MRVRAFATVVVAAFALVACLGGCEKKGEAEKAGEAADKMAKDAKAEADKLKK